MHWSLKKKATIGLKARQNKIMYRGLILNIVSRIVAIAALSFPLAYAAYLSDEEMKSRAADLSRQELLDFVVNSPTDSVGKAFLLIFGLGIVFVKTSEGLAFCLRWGFKKFRKDRYLNVLKIR